MAEIALQRGEYLVAVQEYLKLAQKSTDPEFARRATELAYEYGFDAYALASAERWVALVPDDPAAHAYLGRLYVARNSPDKAWESLNIALGPVEERADRDYVGLAGDLSELADPKRALELFLRFDAEDPGDPGINAAIASLAAEAGELDIAIERARRMLVLAPEWAGSRVMLARYLLAADQTSTAFEQMAFAMEMNPGLPMELEFAQLVALAGEYEDALERIERLDERYPDNPDLLRARALIRLQAGDIGGAQTDFMSLLTDAYFVNECFWYLGQIALQEGDYEQAIRYFERVSAGSWLVPARLSTSQAYLALNDSDRALQVQQDFAAQYPKSRFDTLQPQAEILASTGRYDEAQEVIALALEYKPWEPELWLYQGGLCEQQLDYGGAVKSFERAVELAPQNSTALNALGYTLTISTRRYDDAYGYISRALEIEPDNAAIMDSMGWVLFRQGKTDEARAWLEGAYELLPDAEVAAHLGEVLWASGETDAAWSVWNEALAADPENAALLETVERFSK